MNELLSDEMIRKLVMVTLAVQEHLKGFSDREVLGKGRAVYEVMYKWAEPEATRIAKEVIAESEKRKYQNLARLWVRAETGEKAAF